jgi:transcriptional regulator with PAS, ATPase and Fis domain
LSRLEILASEGWSGGAITVGGVEMVGRSHSFLESLRLLAMLGRSEATVLIEGETGTGKELVARAIHGVSERASQPFVAVNCAALPMELMENELFGHEQAAYTGATSCQHGLVRTAEKGSLFLDEVDSLPLPAQAKLLRLLECGEYRPLGSPRLATADVRVIAATNADLRKAARCGRIRPDFYYRLNVLPIRLPALRDRHGDIPLLADYFLKRFAGRRQRSLPVLSRSVLPRLEQHDWPGNVRELEHVMHRALILAEQTEQILPQHVQLAYGESARSCSPTSFQQAKAEAVNRFERSYLEHLLQEHGGNITRAATAAKKHRRALWELIRKHGIDVERFRNPPASTS